MNDLGDDFEIYGTDNPIEGWTSFLMFKNGWLFEYLLFSSVS
jgi:hypothetical protein